MVNELAGTFEILSFEIISRAPHFGSQEPEVVKKKEIQVRFNEMEELNIQHWPS